MLGSVVEYQCRREGGGSGLILRLMKKLLTDRSTMRV